MSTRVGAAHLDLTASTDAAKASIRAAVGIMRAQLQSIAKPVKVSVSIDQGRVASEIAGVKAKLAGLKAEIGTLFKLDASALTTLLTQVGKQVSDLRDIENRLRTAGAGAGGGRGGTGGGSPGVSNEYLQQLRNLQSDLKRAAIDTAAFETATRNLKTSVDAEIVSLRSAGVLTVQQQARLDSLRATSGQAGAALKRLGDDAARAADQAAKAAAKATADAAKATARAAQEAARAQAEGVGRLARDLQTAQSQYDRGATGLRTYLRELERIRTAGAAAATGLAAGSREAQNLERVMAGLNRGTVKINDASITKLRSDLAAVRAEYERATGAAGRFNFSGQRAATQAYAAELQRLETRIRAVGERANVSGSQMRALNGLSSQLASQSNAINGIFTNVGLSGNVVNALKSLPQFAAAAGGSLGAAASQASSLGAGLAGIVASAGPVGVAIAAVTVVVGGLGLAIAKTVSAYAPLQAAIQNAKGTLGLFGEEGRAAGKQLQALAQDPSLAKLGFGSVQAANAIEELGSRGLETSEILNGGLKTAATLAAASGVKDLTVASEILVGTMRAFNINGTEAAKVPDLLANAANVSALKLEDFRLAIAMGGSAARTSGTSLVDFTGIMSLMRDRLISASDAGTSFKSFVAGLTPNSKEAAAAMKDIGFSAFDAQGKMKPFRAVIENLAVGLQGMTDKQKLTTLELIFGSDGVRIATTALDAYNTKTQSGARLLDERTQALTRQGTAELAARERTNSLAGAQAELAAKITILKQRIGEVLAPAIEGIVRSFIKFIDTAINPALEGLEKIFNLFDKPPAEVRASLKITAADGTTTAILKLLGGGAQGARETIGLAGKIAGFQAELLRGGLSRIRKSYIASDLQKELVTAGLLPQTTDAKSRAKQFNAILDNLDGYAQLLVEHVQKAAQDFRAANTAPGPMQPLRGQGPLSPGQIRATDVTGLGALANLGALTPGGTRYGKAYFDGEIHNGEDLFAKLGTDVTAAFDGYLTTRWSETTGRILELVDSTGKKLLLGHLEGFKGSLKGLPKDIQAAFKASADGRIAVSKGQVIGRVGQTGSLAHADLGPKNAHVHVMAILPNGQVVDPKSVVYEPVQNLVSDADRQGAQRSQGPVDQERLKAYARTLLTKQAQVVKDGDVDGILRMKTAVDKFAAAGPRAAAALDVVRTEMGLAKKEVSEFGAGFDNLAEQLRVAENNFKLSGDAAAYAKALEGISAAALKAAAAEEKANGVGKSSKAISDLAADSALKARQQREALARAEGKTENTAAERAKTRAALLAQLDKDLAAGKKLQYQATVDQLQQSLQTELAAHKNNAAERLRVEQQLGPQILAAQKRVLEAERADSIAAAKETARQQRQNLTDKFGKGKEPKDLLAGIAATEQTALGTAESVFNTKISALYSASTERINAATAAVQAKNKQMADQRLAVEKQVTQTLAGLSESQRQAKVQQEQDELDRLRQNRQARLNAAKGNAAETLRIERETAEEIRAQEEKTAFTALVAAKRKADAEKAATLAGLPSGTTKAQRATVEAQAEAARLRAVSAAYRAYSLAVSKSSEDARQVVDTAAEGQQQALDGLRERYESLTETFNQKLLTGTPSEDETLAYWHDLNVLLADAKKAGLDLSPVIVGLRNQARDLGNSVGGVREWADEMAAATEVGNKRYGDKNALADYATRSTYGVGEEGYNNALAGFGVRSIDELEGINAEAAASLKRVYASVLDGMLADMAAGVERAQTILENARAEMEAQAEQVERDAEAAQIERDAADRANVRGLGNAANPAQQLTGFLAGEGNSYFGERFWTELGSEGRERFRGELEKLSPDDFAGLGETTLRGLLDSIGDDEDFASLAIKIQEGLGKALENSSTSAGYTDLGNVLEQFQGLDSGAAGYADTLRDRLLPELQRIRDAATDPGLKQASEAAIAALNGEVDAAAQLLTLLGQVKLAALERSKASGGLGEGEYIGQKRTLDIEQENARYQLDIQGKTGKALELAETQHQINLGNIIIDSAKAYTDLTARLRQQAADTAAQTETTALERQRRNGEIGETAYLRARTEAQVRAAEREFGVRVASLKKGSPEYIAAEEALQAQVAQIRQQGTFEAADSLEGATEQLKTSARELAQAAGDTEAPYQNQLDLLDKLKVKYPELGTEIDRLITKYQALQLVTQADTDQNLALALVEAQHALAEVEGRNDGPAYLAGLNAALAYWRARLEGLDAGTPAYLAALQKITELEGKVRSAPNPVADRLTDIAKAVGTNGGLKGTISAGLDGLAAYFKAGGAGGGRQSIIAGATALVTGLAGVFKTGDEDIDRVIDTFVSGVQATLSQLAKGDWIGALIAGIATVVSTIVDIFVGGANSAKKAAKEIGEATKDVKFFDLSGYAKTVSRGGFWGFLGFKKSEIDQEAIDIARSLGDAIYSSITTALLDGVKQGKASFGELGLDLRKGLGEQILQGLIDGFLKGAVMQGILQPFLDKYIEAMRSGNAQALAEAANGIQQAAATGNAALQDFYQNVLVPVAKELGIYGQDAPPPEKPADTAPDAVRDLGMSSAPTAVVAAPMWALDQTAAFIDHTAALKRITPLLDRLAADGIAVEAQAHIDIQAPRSDLRAYAARP